MLMIEKLTRNPYILFLPFLLFYIGLILINKRPVLFGDEVRYVDFARHLVQGFYSPPAPHINLWNGPGYPLLLAPLIALKIHTIYMVLMNAVFLYLAVVFLYQALSITATKWIALVGSLLLAVYPNAQSVLPILYTEAFTTFLISSFVYCITLFYVKGKPKYNITAGLILGYLILTKILFAYVVIICVPVCLLLMLIKKQKSAYRQSIYMLIIAFALTIPYLAYTYRLTGKALYFGDSGGMSLYWMSTPFDNEYGDWKMPDLSNSQYPVLFQSAETRAILQKNHSKEIKFILAHNEVEQDALFKKAAIVNITKDPIKFLNNYCCNFSRMLFNFPYSYAYQDAAILRNILIGSLVLWATVTGVIITFLNRRSIIYPVKLILLITGVYLMLSGALSAYPRQLDVIIPVLLFWLGYLVSNLKGFNLKFVVGEDLKNIGLTSLSDLGVYVEDDAIGLND